MTSNRLLIAAAGSGKTTFVVNEAKSIRDGNVLVTTYTEANELEIRRKFGALPSKVTTQTWFSFLLEHGVKTLSKLYSRLQNYGDDIDE